MQDDKKVFSAYFLDPLLWLTFGTPMYNVKGKQWFVRELPKNGDVPKSPLLPRSSPGAIGRHDF